MKGGGSRKQPPPWKPVSVPVQRSQHRKAVQAWRPTPVKVQRARHQAAVKAARTKAHKPRGLSPGSDVACCSAQALGTLFGWDWEQVLELYWRTASDPDAGVSILDTLSAAGVRGMSVGHLFSSQGPAIIGVALPEPHAVAVTPDGTWWSWGQPFNPAEWPELVIEEAWAVTCASG